MWQAGVLTRRQDLQSTLAQFLSVKVNSIGRRKLCVLLITAKSNGSDSEADYLYARLTVA